MHEQYEEICAAASIGQASPEELAQLSDHLPKCGMCRRTYSEFTNMAAEQYAHNLTSSSQVSAEEVQHLPDLDMLQRRFLKRAAEKGFISNSRSHSRTPANSYPILVGFWQQLASNPSLRTLAAVIAIVAFTASGYEVGRKAHLRSPSTTAAQHSVNPSRETAGAIPHSNPNATTLESESRVPQLEADLKASELRLHQAEESLKVRSDERQQALDERTQLLATIDQLQARLHVLDGLVQANGADKSRLEEEATKLKNEVQSAQTTYVADQIKIRELNEQLGQKSAESERNGQLLERDRDIRDLMTARNLHIFDVFDTDAKGKTEPAFGRIFYTEGKSLIFYAYDLNEKKLENANYHYKVWGGQEAQKDKVTNLGVFYSDDRAQRRWVFKCRDPKVLSQIDSVFVTLEREGTDSSHPKGQKLLDAYLGGIANHP